MIFKQTKTINSQIYKDALFIREIVFINEQNVSKNEEIDELENKCIHVVAYQNDVPLATARLYITEDTICKIQRVAVLKEFRSQHIGSKLILELEQIAKTLNLHKIKLGAQNHAIPFYEKLGYTVCSEEYIDANILHHDMEKLLQ